MGEASNDIDNTEQFKQSFREEAREILVDLESALLELNKNNSDIELVGRIFRGLHTIKGSGAMFGFERMASFTHDLETAFDEVRNGRLTITAELIDLTLSALDQIRAMLDEGIGAAHADSAACERILAEVRRIARLRDAQAPETMAAPAPLSAAKGIERSWHIRFFPGPEFLRNGANPLLLLNELASLGGLSVRAVMDCVPPLGEMDPERCYIGWEMVLITSEDKDAMHDVFIFVEDMCELEFDPEEISIPSAEADAAAQSDKVARGLEESRSQTGGRRSYDKADNATSLRVPAAKLDQYVDLVGELVTVQARLSEMAVRRDDLEISQVSEEIERLTSSLRENSMNIRMLPIRATFEKFRRLVHDLARDLGKDVELTLEGADTELDKTVIDQLSDPLMHLIRNSMDHGIGTRSARTAQGKRGTATIHLSAKHSGASVLISVSDDGRGIDAEAVRARAIEKGLVAAGDPLNEQQIYALLFQPGFSTAKQVTDVSGRGVGMDVVKQRVESLRGMIDVASKKGVGTTVTLRLPLTLAIIDGLLVEVGEASFVLPLANTLECIELSEADTKRANGKHLVDVRDELIPYIRLRERFHVTGARPAIEQIMVVETSEGRYGFVVDGVVGNCQTVIKNLGRFYRHVQVVSGATILGNGTVALILDPERLAQDAVRDSLTRPRGRSAGKTSSRPRERAQQSVQRGTMRSGQTASASPATNQPI